MKGKVRLRWVTFVAAALAAGGATSASQLIHQPWGAFLAGASVTATFLVGALLPDVAARATSRPAGGGVLSTVAQAGLQTSTSAYSADWGCALTSDPQQDNTGRALEDL